MRATSVVRRPAVKAERVVDTITLDHEARHRRRVSLTGDRGIDFLLDLDRATVMNDGDALKLEDGRLVQVKAAPERLVEITTDNPLRLMKVAWHVGNRHVAAEIGDSAIWIAHDHVLLEMVRGLGAKAQVVERPFRPEAGAYDGGHDHGHHGHDHDGHGHGHDHAHPHGDHAHHAHGPGCGHDHGAHDHKHDAHKHHAHDGHSHGQHDHGHHHEGGHRHG